MASGWPLPEDASDADLAQALAQAWRAGDPHAVLVAGRALERRRLSGSSVARVRRTLLRLGRFADALRLTEQRPAAPSDGRGAYERAWALAAMDRLDEALQTLAQARERGLPPDQAAGLDQVLRAEMDPSGLEAWDQVRCVAGEALTLGLGDAAARQLAAALAQGAYEPNLGLDKDELAEALDLAQAALRFCRPAEAGMLLEALGPLYAEGCDKAAYYAVREVLAGGPDDGADMDAGPGEPERFALRYLLALACATARRRPAAIHRLGSLSALGELAADAQCDLARCVGEETLQDRKLGFAPKAERRRIVDVFPFNGELTLLDIKLHEMAGWVDRFVIVEARTSFSGQPKQLFFEQARSRYQAFADQIIYVVVDGFPEHLDSPAARQAYQRDQGLRGLDGQCAPQDLVLLSDVGEILDREVMGTFEGLFAVCAVDSFAHFLNLRLTGEANQRSAAVALEARFLAGCPISYARLGLRTYSKTRIANAGWRFGALYERSGQPSDQSALLQAIRAGKPPAGFEQFALDAGLPRTVRERRRELEDFILPE